MFIISKRLELQTLLENTLGSRNVYFQAPPSNSMNYPCVVYSKSSIKSKFANGSMYMGKTAYTIIIMDPDPDSDIPDKFLKLPFCSFVRNYKSDNLNHDVYNLYY